MTTFIVKIFLNFLTVDNLCTVLAKIISKLLSYASKKGGKAWDITKSVIVKVNNWTSLFLQVYEDEELDKEEEKLIAEAIKNGTDIAKIVDILKKSSKGKASEETKAEEKKKPAAKKSSAKAPSKRKDSAIKRSSKSK